ncbi:MAG: preprotein translocase subunit SecE [Chitinophagaceae bacterium]
MSKIVTFFKKVGNFCKLSFIEISEHVTWPSWNHLQQYTIIVIIGCVFISLIVWLMDTFSNQTMKIIYDIFVK